MTGDIVAVHLRAAFQGIIADRTGQARRALEESAGIVGRPDISGGGWVASRTGRAGTR